jgi:hypothetical protein
MAPVFVATGKLKSSAIATRGCLLPCDAAEETCLLHLPLPVLNRLREVRRLYALRSGEVGDGAPDLEQPVIGAGA